MYDVNVSPALKNSGADPLERRSRRSRSCYLGMKVKGRATPPACGSPELDRGKRSVLGVLLGIFFEQFILHVAGNEFVRGEFHRE